MCVSVCALVGRLLNSFTDDDEKVLSQNEGNSLPFVPKLLFLMIQEVTKVDVEQLEEEKQEKEEEGEDELGESLKKRRTCGGLAHLSVLLHHDVGVVSVSNSKDECRHAVTCTRAGEEINGTVIPERQTERNRCA